MKFIGIRKQLKPSTTIFINVATIQRPPIQHPNGFWDGRIDSYRPGFSVAGFRQ
jgi:hypothetical protein